MTQKPLLVTTALPYANGDLHIGHIVEHTQADIWVRFQRMSGRECYFFSADDTHGTPIMLKAKSQGVQPEELIAKVLEDHKRDSNDYGTCFDNYGSTHSESNKAITYDIFKYLQSKDSFEKKEIEQFYCEHDQMFLPDRFIGGTCPACKTPEQYGDQCEKCSKTYEPKDLLEPKCSLCKNTPILKPTEHLYFKLSDHQDFLQKWVPAHTQKAVSQKLDEWLKESLQDWCISRDEPYFGFEIPDHPGKYFYVWLDAPIGYMSSAQDWCKKNNKDFDKLWQDSEIHHFIGKDIIAFHCLFWPALLKQADKNTPEEVHVHGFLTVNGAKMSKSKGTFILIKDYLKFMEPTYLRYYLACKLSATVDDFDFSLEDFVNRVNSDLIGKITNIGSRGFQMLQKKLDGKLAPLDGDSLKLLERATSRSQEISAYYQNCEFSKAMVAIREVAEDANKYFDETAPWKLIKTDPEATRQSLSLTIHWFRVLAIYLKPVIPEFAKKVEALLSEEFSWDSVQTTLDPTLEIPTFSHLATRIDQETLEKIIEAGKPGE